VRAPKEVLHKLQFFVELLHGGVCGAEFVEQSQTPPKPLEVKMCSPDVCCGVAAGSNQACFPCKKNKLLAGLGIEIIHIRPTGSVCRIRVA